MRAPSGSSPSVRAKSRGAPVTTTRMPSRMPSFFGSGVPEYPARDPGLAAMSLDRLASAARITRALAQLARRAQDRFHQADRDVAHEQPAEREGDRSEERR